MTTAHPFHPTLLLPRLLRSLALAGPLGFLALTGGCSSETTTVVVDEERTGFLTVEWSIHGTFDPGLCAFYSVDAMELVVYDRFENFLFEEEALCEDFILTVELLPGIYHADATLVGFADEAATLTEPIDNIDILEDSEVVVDLDFPPGSFL